MDPPILEQVAAEAVAAAEAASEAANAAPTEEELQALAAAAAAHEAAWARAASAAAAAHAAWRAAKDKAVAAKAAKHNAGRSSEAALEVVLANPAARAALLTFNAFGRVDGRESRSAARLVSKLARSTYDAHATCVDWKVGDFGGGALAPLECMREALARFPQVQRLWLRLGDADPLAIVDALSAPLPQVTEIFLSFGRAGGAAADAAPQPNYFLPICQHVRLTWPRLTSLEVKTSSCELDDACMLDLVSGDWPLQKFVFMGGFLSPVALQALAAAPWAARLEKLSLEAISLTPPHVQAIRNGGWPQLRHLELSMGEPPMCDEGLSQLLAAPWVAGLEELTLSLNRISPHGAQRLLGVQWQRLTRLELGRQYTIGYELRDREEFYELSLELEARHSGLDVDVFGIDDEGGSDSGGDDGDEEEGGDSDFDSDDDEGGSDSDDDDFSEDE